MHKTIKLNLGSGSDYKEGYINIDNDESIKADLYCDFVNKIPFENGTVDEIFCKNVFEHIPNPLNFLLEMKRILKKNGKITIITSNASYFIYHFPRKKAYHDSYNLYHPESDRHYFMFQKGHLLAFSKKAGLKNKRIIYYISNQDKGRDNLFQKIVGWFIGKKFGYSDFLWEMTK